ncbi:MAG: CBS domain-containing protein [Legionella sp.]|nr:MAG: CBS domain-containing protein [Legionella sp.]
MTIREVMQTQIITINKNLTYKEATQILLEHKISGAPVVDDQGKLVGMVSEKDLFKVLYPYYRSYYEHPEDYVNFEEREHKAHDIQDHAVETIMTKNLTTISPSEKVMAAGGLMLARGIHRLPVMENGQLVGLVTRRDIYHSIFKKELGV